MRATTFKSAIILCLLGFIALHAWMLWKVHDSILRGYSDFAAFYTAGKIMRQGQSTRLYDLGLQWQIQQEFASTVTIRRGPLPYIRPPFEAILFLLFAYLSYPAAFIVWTTVKILILFLIPFLLPLDVRPGGASFRTALLAGLLCLAYPPVAFDLIQGQDSILLLLILVMVFVSLRQGADFRSGVWLALGLFKFHLVLPIFSVFLFRKKTGTIFGFLSTSLLLFLLSVMLVGWAGVLVYPKYLWHLFQAPATAGFKPQDMPNLRGLLTLFLGASRTPSVAHWLLAGVVVLGIAVAAWLWHVDNRDPDSIATGLSVCIVITIVTSYYANSYDMTLLVLPMLLLGVRLSRPSEIQGWPRITLIACLALLLFSPLHWVIALRHDEYSWMAVVLVLFGVPLAASSRSANAATPRVSPSSPVR